MLRVEFGRYINLLICYYENIVDGEDDWGDGNNDDL